MFIKFLNVLTECKRQTLSYYFNHNICSEIENNNSPAECCFNTDIEIDLITRAATIRWYSFPTFSRQIDVSMLVRFHKVNC